MSRNNSQIDQIFFRSETPDHEQLLAYAKGQLSPSEARKVEEALVDDPFLADALEGIEMVGTDTFEEMMADIDQALDQRLSDDDDSGEEGGKEIQFEPAARTVAAPTKKNRSFRLLSIAASIAILAVVGVFLFKGAAFDPTSYYNDPSNGTVRGHVEFYHQGDQTPENEKRIYDEGSSLFWKGQFDEASKLFEGLSQPSAKLMAGHCHFKMENYQQAAQFFQEVISLGGVLQHDGEYNLALALLADDKGEEAQKKLEEMAGNKRHSYYKQAREILKKLD